LILLGNFFHAPVAFIFGPDFLFLVPSHFEIAPTGLAQCRFFSSLKQFGNALLFSLFFLSPCCCKIDVRTFCSDTTYVVHRDINNIEYSKNSNGFCYFVFFGSLDQVLLKMSTILLNYPTKFLYIVTVVSD
jgi:hypothetical protein